jgi:hypothetical protein
MKPSIHHHGKTTTILYQCLGISLFAFTACEADPSMQNPTMATSRTNRWPSKTTRTAKTASEAKKCVPDPQYPGWGWDGEKSCQTAETAGDGQTCVPDPQYPGWGWDGEKSCQTAETAGDGQTCVPDSRFPGWGWDGEKSCQTAETAEQTQETAPSPDSEAEETFDDSVGQAIDSPEASEETGFLTEVTGRINMALQHPNQCGLGYSGDERVDGVLIAGVDGTSFGSKYDGVKTAICGVCYSFSKDSQTYTIKMVDRIWQNDGVEGWQYKEKADADAKKNGWAKGTPQVDIAEELFNKLGRNNFTVTLKKTGCP